MRTHALVAALALVLPFGLPGAMDADARGKRAEAIRLQSEASLLVTGSLDIDAKGKVVRYALNQQETVPPSIVAMVARLAPQWTFEPLALPEKSLGRTKMSLRFVAKPQSSGDYLVELRSAHFNTDMPPERRVRIAERGTMPKYPRSLGAFRISGTVYVVVQIGRDGAVMNIDASHVDLNVYGDDKDMAQWREELAKASIQAIRGWRFAPPTEGEDAASPYWVGTLPVVYSPFDQPPLREDRWQTYLPGPRKRIPWKDPEGVAADNSDALMPGEFHGTAGTRRLRGPLAGS